MNGPRLWVWVVAPRPEATAADWRVLTDAERRRVEAMGHPAVRARSVTARAALRRLLGLALDIEPGEVHLGVAPGGRVVLADRAAGPWCSVSHTDGLVVVAGAEGGPVGVDVERRDRRPLPPPHLWLSAREQAVLAETGIPHDRLVRRWTAKEAVAKARGTGLGASLREIDVDDATGRVDAHTSQWRVRPLDVGPEHVATLATTDAGAAP